MMRLIIIIVLVCAGSLGLAQTGIISTIAGCDTAGYRGDGGVTDTSCMNMPFCLYKQNSKLYIADALNNRIRQIDLNTGIIKSIAGTGVMGYAGDGDLAINAQLSLPSGIFVDRFDNLYIADAGNNRIRKINGITGVITTIAGNGMADYTGDGASALDAALNGPCSVFVDTSGDMYISDFNNNVIRLIQTATGIINTIAGNGTPGYTGDHGPATLAKLAGPLFMFTNKNGDLIFSDKWNSVIRKIDNATGIISTIAGSGIAGYSGDNGLAVNAVLNNPEGIFIDKNDNIYFTEYYNGTVRRIDGVTGIITTVVGYGVQGFGGDGGPASNAKLQADFAYVDDNGDIYIADAGNNRIRKVTHPLSVTDAKVMQSFRLYPNPTTGIFTIEGSANKTFRIEAVNSLGKSVYANKSVTSNQSIDMSFLPSGVYFVQISDNQTVSTEKLIIQH